MGAIHYYEKERVFKLDTPHTSYLIGIVDEEKFLGHIYYGAKITDYDVRALMRTGEAPFVPSQNNRSMLPRDLLPKPSPLDAPFSGCVSDGVSGARRRRLQGECDFRIGQKRQYGGAAALQGA